MANLPSWQEKFSWANRSGGLIKSDGSSSLEDILNRAANLQWYLSTYGIKGQYRDDHSPSLYWMRALRFRLALTPYIAGRCLFLTKTGGVGLMPKGYRDGDELWFLAGAKTPMILRPLANGHFAFVGEASLMGYMHGEICDIHSSRKLKSIVLE